MNHRLIHELGHELSSIRDYWATYTLDQQNGGCYGQVGDDNIAVRDADKGAVLNARVLWFFSAMYSYGASPADLHLARRSYSYFRDHFVDREFGGVYWTVAASGQPKDVKKQVYAIAFAIYAFSEFYRASKDAGALELAKELYGALERYSFDPVNQGYCEAFSRDWSALADLRLSDKDANEKKTMNTHLHVLEAYCNLYRVWPDSGLSTRLTGLLSVFQQRIVDPQTHHLRLFFDENWQSKSAIISFGHDIEASWLLLEAARVIGDPALIAQFRSTTIAMTEAAMTGLADNGGLNYEFEAGRWNKEKHWWVQAEAMVGLYNAYEMTGERAYLDKVEQCWEFTSAHLIDRQRGEWFWGVNDDLSLMPGYYKAGLWKCPYHNGRACLELISRMTDRQAIT